MGNIANSLFGVLDERFAEEYTRAKEPIKQNERLFNNLRVKQTSIMKSEYNLVKRIKEMAKQHKVINKHLNSFDKAINTLQLAVNEVNKN